MPTSKNWTHFVSLNSLSIILSSWNTEGLLFAIVVLNLIFGQFLTHLQGKLKMCGYDIFLYCIWYKVTKVGMWYAIANNTCFLFLFVFLLSLLVLESRILKVNVITSGNSWHTITIKFVNGLLLILLLLPWSSLFIFPSVPLSQPVLEGLR